MTTEHFCRSKVTIPRLLLPANDPRSTGSKSPRKEAGLFSSFAQFLSISSDYDDDQNEAQILHFEKLARTAVGACAIEELVQETSCVEDSTVLKFVESMISLSYDSPKATMSFTGSTKDCQALSTNDSEFSQSSVFLLELMFRTLLKNKDRLKILWPTLNLHLQKIIKPQTPVVLIERASTNVLRLLLRLSHVVIH
jgi:hypothetical protein